MKNLVVVAFSIVCFLCVEARHHFASAQVVAEPPTVVSPTYIAVPAPLQETITEPPSPQYVWVAGHWDRTPDSWSWTAGKWVQPPFSSAYWVPGYWRHRDGQFVWEDAHWAAASQGVVVAKPVTLPPVYEEVRPPVPEASSTVTWQPGHWEWRGTWVWIPGAYVATATTQARWIEGQWVSGPDGMWRWCPAHWEAS